jgi:chemotaxis protein CheD
MTRRPVMARTPLSGATRIHLLEGQYHVSGDPAVVLTTTLGSCVAACLRDPEAQVGGMNHFLLAGDGEAARYGAYAMEVLITALLARGARRERLQAKLFGGGQLLQGVTNVGDQNVAFAEDFLEREGIQLLAGSVRGPHARKIQYWPVSGRARQLELARGKAHVFARERAATARRADYGDVELF